MATLDQIIDSVLNPESSGALSGQALVVQNHLSQLRLFTIRAGLELLPAQDDQYDTRKKFIDRIWKINQLELYLDRMLDLMCCKGELLLYLRPTKDGTYKVYFYDKDNFKAKYNRDGDLTEVIVRYSYKEETNFDGIQNQRWIKLTITSDTIHQFESEQMPSFEQEFDTLNKVQVLENTLKFVPCVVVKNKPTGPGLPGQSEFTWLKNQIERHEGMSVGMADNLEYFGGPTLVSTRTTHELTEAVADEGISQNLSRHRTMSSAAGWTGGGQGSMRYVEPNSRGNLNNGRGVRIKKVIGNVQPDERFGYVSPDPITPDHTQYFRQNREEIHFALGGIDELGISSNATAYEMKVVYGKIATTAKKKATALYTYGLCKLFELAIAAEEDLFKQSLSAILKKPLEQMTDGFIGQLMEQGKLPPGTVGLPPIGSREVKWRWTGPVFEESADDQQRKSIVVRNMQELGVRSEEALKFFFDDKTPKELEGMLSGGVGFRYFNAIASSLQQVLGMYGQMMQMPDPNNPNQPLAAAIPVSPLINRLAEVLFNELNYGKQYDPVSPGDLPDYNTGYANFLAAAAPTGQLPGAGFGGNGTPAGLLPAASPNNSLSVPAYLSGPYPSPSAAAGITPYPVQGIGQPVGSGIQPGSGTPEYSVGLPEPGAVLANAGSGYASYGERLPIPAGYPTAGLPPDLAVSAGQPGSIWQQLFPTFTAAVKRTRKK